MTRIGRLGRTVCWVLTLSLVLALPTAAYAQKAKDKDKSEFEPDTSKNAYVLPYMTLALGIALGIIVVCLPPRRTGREINEPI